MSVEQCLYVRLADELVQPKDSERVIIDCFSFDCIATLLQFSSFDFFF